MNALLVFAGGGLGSLLRFGIGQLGTFFGWGKSLFPWSTLLANVLACLFMALLVGLDQESISAKTRMFGMIGFCGGLSTFSTFSLENHRLLQEGAWGFLALNILLSTAGCLAIFFLYQRSLTLE